MSNKKHRAGEPLTYDVKNVDGEVVATFLFPPNTIPDQETTNHNPFTLDEYTRLIEELTPAEFERLYMNKATKEK